MHLYVLPLPVSESICRSFRRTFRMQFRQQILTGQILPTKCNPSSYSASPFIHSFHCLSLEGFHNPSFSEGPAAYRFLVAPRLLRDSFRLSDLQSRDKGNVASRQQLYVSRTISSVQNHHIPSTAFIHFVYNFLRKFILSL